MSSISRRDSLKYITLASLSAGVIACEPRTNDTTKPHVHTTESTGFGNLSEEDLALLDQKFFTDHEMETLRVLANIIIPTDENSGNAEDAGVPKFIEFMMLDQPDLQVPMRGGLRWIDLQSLKRFKNDFVQCEEKDQLAIIDDIAFPDTAPAEFSQGVAFFNSLRDFVATGFYTSKIGMDDLQYQGNRPSVWNGPPQAWLDKLGVADLL